MCRIICAAFLLMNMLLFSCSLVEHTPCQKNCEYSRRDCIQLCGDPNSAGITMKYDGGHETGSVSSCIDGCNDKSRRCLERCDEDRKANEKTE